LLTGLQAVGQVKGWKVQQLVFVGGTCGSVHVESVSTDVSRVEVAASFQNTSAVVGNLE
jgi:purine-nucleoside phosphorylase